MGYDFVFFDASGTLIHGEPNYADIYVRACRDCGVTITEEAIGRGLAAAWEPANAAGGMLPPCVNANADAYAAWEHQLEMDVLRHAGLACDLGAIARHLIDLKHDPANWRVFPDARRALDAVAASGMGMAVISNWEWSLPDILEALDLARYFAFVLVSARFGLAKPHPSIFRKALSLAGAPAGRVMCVGDDYEFDVLPAGRLGMATVLVDRRRRGNHDCVTVESLDELPWLLGLAGAT